ncbi:hypothetical protein CA265_11720 [Sphingobacteriaceae bacterium GW460-11-11-14-LB5]|nr:hypothetical protein CA265_11720 [Sphingobacteriaceae bacterium GW460-11-11-14-LB5]
MKIYFLLAKIKYWLNFIPLYMKLSTLLLFIVIMHTNAKSVGQQITVNAKNQPLQQLFKVIEKQSAYVFFYSPTDIKETRSTVSAVNQNIEAIMEQCLKNSSLIYKVVGKNIIISKKDEVLSPVADIVIRGKVTDTTGQALPDVSVLVKGTTQGTRTDKNGNFMLTLKDSKSTLIISLIGYSSKEINVSSSGVLDIVLKEAANQLQNVVVVGYGSQKKENLIGSVAQVSAKDINNRTAPSLSNALTGQLPGVTLIQRSGQPGSDGANIQVRGLGSFGASAVPFILVDGIPVNSFNDINPNEVSSISVLKDASTAAIYGSRAANGVILVTTKTGQGADGKLAINYNGYAGFQKPTAYPNFVNSTDYARLINEAQPGTYSAAEIQKFTDGSDPNNYPNSNWIDMVFKKSAFQTGHNLSFANNTKNTQYLVAFGLLDQDGIVAKNNYNRYNLRLNLTNKILDNLTLTSRVSAAQYSDNQPAPPANLDFNDMLTAIGQAVRTPPTYVNQLTNGDYGLGFIGKGTPYTYLNNESFYKNKQTDLLINERIDYKVIPELTLSVIGAYTQLSGTEKRYLSTQRLNSLVNTGPGNLTQISTLNYYKTFQQLAEFKKNFGAHQLGVLAGHTFEYNYNSRNAASRGNYFTNALTELNAGDASTQTNNGTASEAALDSYFGRLNYSFANRYLVEGTIRYDGSSRFGPSNKYATYPAVAVGWRISEEKFLKNKLSWLNELKFKASYGTLGNQNIGNYPYQELLVSGFNYSFGNVIYPGAALNNVVDPNIKWESTRTKDIGIEGTLFKTLNFSATYFDRYTYDILVVPTGSVSRVLGFSLSNVNSGSLSNKGFEFTLDYRNKIGELSYNVGGNLSIITNKVLDLGVGNVNQPNGLIGNGSTIFIGYPLNIYYGHVADGIFVNPADVASYPTQTAINPTVQPGDIRYKDISGPNGLPDGKVDATYDRTYLGSQIPKYTFALNIGLNYKNFDLQINGQGVAKVKGQLNGYAGFAFFGNGSIQQYMADDHWTTSNPNPNAKYPRLQVIPNAGTPNTLASSFYLLDASYFKIRNIQLGYTLPATLFKNTLIKSLRINASAQNAISFHKYPKGWDPEINSGGAYYPIMANYTFGLNANF